MNRVDRVARLPVYMQSFSIVVDLTVSILSTLSINTYIVYEYLLCLRISTLSKNIYFVYQFITIATELNRICMAYVCTIGRTSRATSSKFQVKFAQLYLLFIWSYNSITSESMTANLICILDDVTLSYDRLQMCILYENVLFTRET